MWLVWCRYDVKRYETAASTKLEFVDIYYQWVIIYLGKNPKGEIVSFGLQMLVGVFPVDPHEKKKK